MSPNDMDSSPAPSDPELAALNGVDIKTNGQLEADDDQADLEPLPAIAVPDSGETSEGGKLKMIVTLLKKCLGVKDLAAMRLSLPASLLEPIPNLEYWQYLDRPDLFAAINDSEDPLERMLAVLRFTFTKDLKFIRGKVVKPYNSVLGEHFRAHWDVLPIAYPADPSHPPVHREHTTAPVPSANSSSIFGRGPKDESVLSFRSAKSAPSPTTSKRTSSLFDFASARVTPLPKNSEPTSPQQQLQPTAVESNLAARVSNLSLGSGSGSGSLDVDGDGDAEAQAGERVRIAYLTEQVSHHPPISAYRAACPARGLVLTGIDQISARVSGTGVRVAPGALNKGIFVQITDGAGAGEQYQITHPVAMVNGMLRGSFYVTIGDSTIVTCSSTGGKERGRERLRAIIEYKEESWIGSPKYALEGVIHTYLEGETAHEAWTKVKHVPRHVVVATLDGSWRTRVRWRRTPSTASPRSSSSSKSNLAAAGRAGEDAVLVDLSTLLLMPKRVRPLERQHAYESRRLWESVTGGLLAKEYGEATKHKQAIEQRQRDKAAERKRRGEEFIPAYFEKDIESGIPTLTPEGLKVLEDELRTVDGEL